MLVFLRRHLTYANVAATMALVFAMGGSAIAARHYLINSTRQINPKVLKALRVAGKTGPAGPQGAAGAQGREGQAGAPGAVGPTFSAHGGRELPISPKLADLTPVKTLVVDLPSPGSLMISGSFYGVVKCGSGLGSCAQPQLVLTVDGIVVPNSERLLGEFIGQNEVAPSSGDETFSTSGRLSAVSAGQHTVTLETGVVPIEPGIAEGKLTPLMVGADDAAIDVTLTG